MTEGELSGAVVAVTGAGRGLGLAYALDLASRGASVVVSTRARPAGEPGSAEAAVAQIVARGGRAAACPLSVEADDAGAQLLDAALRAFGRLDGLVNNAGVPEAKSLHKQTMAEFRSVFEVNFFGTLNVTLPIYRHMREQGGGRIVITTSAAGLHGVHGMAAYSSSKAALVGLMRVLALEGASRDVKANAIAPYALTGMTEGYLPHPVAEAVPPEAVAPIVSWLVSPECPLNGETLVAGAGRVRRAVRIENMGLEVGPDPAPTQLSAATEALLDLAEWSMPPDGNAAFEAFLAAKPPRWPPGDLR